MTALLRLPKTMALLAGWGLAWQLACADEATLRSLPRHALVIGNSQYPVGELVNPRNDAQAIAQRLREAGFSVTLRMDAGRTDMQHAIRDYTQALARDKGVGVFYYAGHGVQLNWRNFLVPIDARIKTLPDIQAQAVDMGSLVDGLARARNALNLVILDACRNNPFGADFRVDDKGLSQLDAPPGTLLAYATAPGNTAEDGEGSHGLYTDRLLAEMQVPGAAVEDVFKRVRLAVRKQSQGGQIPWESTSLEADFSFVPGAVSRDAAREFADDLASWLKLRTTQSPEALEAFLQQRPDGKFSELAQFRLDQLLAAKGEKPVRPRAAALSAEACVPGSPGYAAPAGPSQPFKVGERYSYRRINLLDGAERERFSQTVAKIEGDEVWFDDWKTVTDLFGNNVRAPDGRKWTPYQFFIHDYQVGKRWTAQFLVTQADGKTVNTDFELRVAGRERITLAAGTLDAYRIEARGINRSNGALLERTAWVAPDRMRGVLAQDNLVRLGDKLVEGERIELLELSMVKPRPEPRSGNSYGNSGY
jgi:Caspase domain